MESLPSFATLAPTEPDLPALQAAYAAATTLATDPDTPPSEAVQAWEAACRPARQWQSWTRLRFHQDTSDPDRKAGRKRADVLEGELKKLDDTLLEALLARPDRSALDDAVSPAVTARWAATRAGYSPAIADDLLAEEELAAEYIALKAAARIDFRGTEHSLVTLAKETVAADRGTREAAERARWGWFDANRDTLDDQFDRLVALRDGMAKTLGLPDFVALGYLRMQRIDYGRADVAKFREQVRTRLVPLADRLMRERAADMDVELRLWDEAIPGKKGPTPLVCGMDGLGDAGIGAFDRLDPAISAFYRELYGQGWMDLGARPGKAGGGFCTWMHDVRSPYVFCSGNGSSSDAKTLVHEVGHAFQCWSSREAPVSTCVFPTYESAEIHSMGLEHLAWPVLDAFFGERADDFRRDHLVRGLRFIPYGVAVDHFQHLVYENPTATPAERHAMWAELERTYMPWRHYGDLPHVSDGGYWQIQRHIYARPFYYIDYTLAQTCALQLWASSLTDHAGTMERYHALCQKGGTLPFQALCASGGLTSPFADGCLDAVVTGAEEWLASH